MTKENVARKAFMNSRTIALTAMLLAVLLSFSTQPFNAVQAARDAYQWKQLKIGGGGFVTGLVIHPRNDNLIYIRTDVGGAYKLGKDHTWQQLLTQRSVPDPASTGYSVESIAISPRNSRVLYVAVGDDLSSQSGRILKSTDEGKSFKDNGQRWSIGGNQDFRTGGERLAVDPNNDRVVYFGSRKEGLWVTNDAGGTWKQVATSSVPIGANSGTPAGNQFVVFDPTSGTIQGKTKRIYVGVAGAGIYRSDDAGATWNNVVPIAATQLPFTSSLASDGTLYVSIFSTAGNGEVLRYNPLTGETTTITPSSGGNYYQVAADPHNPQRVIVGSGGISNGNIWRTTNGGASWDTLNISISSKTIPWIVNTDESNYLTSARLLFDPHAKDTLWFAQGTGVWYAKKNDGPTINWNFFSKGIEETVTTDLIAPPGGNPVSTIYDRQGFYHSNVNRYPRQPLVDSAFWGGTSLDYSGGTPTTLVTVQAKNNYYPALTGRGATSTDGGKTWHLFESAPDNAVGGNVAISATSQSTIVWQPSTGNFGQGMAPSYSSDGGKTWQQSSGIAEPLNTHWLFWWGSKRALAADKVNNAFYEITFSTTASPTGAFYTSVDGGKTFVPAHYSPFCSVSGDCHVFGQLHATPGYAGHVWSSAAKDGLWYSTNAGQSAWTKIDAVQEARAFGFGKPLPGYSYPAIYLYGKANGATSFGIYRSADQGKTWKLLSQAPLDIYDQANVVTGDMNKAGRVYVGFGGNGFAFGDEEH